MTANEIVFRVLDLLESLAIPYILVGSYSSNAYGIPRSTQDADFVIELGDRSVKSIAKSLLPEIILDPQMGFETVTGVYRYVATHPASGFKIEFFLLNDEPFHQMRFSRRVQADVHGRLVWLPTPEDVIVQKLRWFLRAKRPKDKSDSFDVIVVQADKLDLSYIREWTDRHGSRSIFEELLVKAAQVTDSP